MPCKHEGGSDPCERYDNGNCIGNAAKYGREYRKSHPEEYKANHKRSNKQFAMSSTFTGGDTGKATAACELLVRSDLSKRGFEVTVPVSPTAQHDLHVELPSVGWKGVQIKSGKLYVPTNTLHLTVGKKSCRSPITAIVYLPTNRIEYRPGTEKVPRELL